MKIAIIILLMTFSSLFCETIWQDNFEGLPQWQLSGEFEIDQPQGLGGDYGNPDPTSAYEGFQVLGVDLTGTGGYPGDYENNLGDDEYCAISPSMDCSGFLNVELAFMFWLNVEQPAYDHASIDISNDDGTTWLELWTNTSVIENSSWNLGTYDISAIADLNENVRIRFTIGSTDGSWQYSGWNIDDLIVTGDQVVYGAIEGNVVDSVNGEPVSFAQIYQQFGTTISDGDGYFLLTSIPTGMRTITINAIGFLTFISEEFEVTENDTTYVLCELIVNPDIPPSPQNLTADIYDENNVLLNWEPPNTRDILLAYNVYRNGYLIVSVLEEFFDDQDLVAGSYDYFVSAVYDVGESLPTDSVNVLINGVSVFDDQLTLTDFQLTNYPNPFNPSTTITFELNSENTEDTESATTPPPTTKETPTEEPEEETEQESYFGKRPRWGDIIDPDETKW